MAILGFICYCKHHRLNILLDFYDLLICDQFPTCLLFNISICFYIKHQGPQDDHGCLERWWRRNIARQKRCFELLTSLVLILQVKYSLIFWHYFIGTININKNINLRTELKFRCQKAFCERNQLFFRRRLQSLFSLHNKKYT